MSVFKQKNGSVIVKDKAGRITKHLPSTRSAKSSPSAIPPVLHEHAGGAEIKVEAPNQSLAVLWRSLYSREIKRHQFNVSRPL